ncbi:hypothetical protein JCM19233_5536 [Vibrio astriarenae]|nr:hypothetical protein JCM19233_5536 [Vibrio sp. C7]
MYTGLSESEKATLIDCTDVDVDAEEALVSYCYDTHSFIGQTVIESEALVIVDEDEVFGDPGAKLILRDGGGISLASFSNITLRRELQIDGENPGSITLAEGSSLSFMNDYGIKGSSGLTINGPGQIVMPSTLSLSGTLNVSKTSVLFDGDLSSTSFITIEDSALLQGKGVLPSVSLVGNATLDLQGNLHVSGNLELDSSSALGLKPYTDTDSIVVDGGIKLDDSILNLSIDSIEEIPFDTPIRLIKSKGTIEGEFSEIVASNPDLSVSVSYEDSGIFVTINKADLQ